MSDDTTINVLHEGNMQFAAESSCGYKIPIEPSISLGGSGRYPNPIDYLIASLGSCTGIKVITGLAQRGITPESLTVNVNGFRSEMPPNVFEKIHLTFMLTGNMDDRTVAEVVRKTVTQTCPIAVMLGKAANLTWEHCIMSADATI
jgi:putative redox protein